jgi:hypothetical protein
MLEEDDMALAQQAAREQWCACLNDWLRQKGSGLLMTMLVKGQGMSNALVKAEPATSFAAFLSGRSDAPAAPTAKTWTTSELLAVDIVSEAARLLSRAATGRQTHWRWPGGRTFRSGVSGRHHQPPPCRLTLTVQLARRWESSPGRWKCVT